jgi:hypothetical protein
VEAISTSFESLGDCLNKRYIAWANRNQDKRLHPLPFVADGPGSGKLRFFQEISSSFKGFCYLEREV